MSAWNASAWRNNILRLAAGLFAAVFFVVMLWPVSAQRGKPADAAVTCATCHAGVVNAYAHAPMRHAMEPEGANPVLNTHPDLKLEQNGYSYSVQTKDGKSTYTVTDSTGSLTVPVRWHFGTHAQTWVLEKDGRLYESMVSYFPRANGLATTPGDQKLTPHNLTEAMGRELAVWETGTCFRCHSTGVKEAEPLDAAKLAASKPSPGLDCEHCHAGASQHMTDAVQGNFKTIPASLKRLDSESMSTFCGQCHRSWDTVLRNRWHGPAFVRFQPFRLALSRCFSGNDSRISCIACHDPHQPLNHSAAYYDSKCLACHGEAAHAVASAKSPPLPMAKTCLVAKENCTSCHMPKVELPGGNAQFSDHYIRIVKPGEAYPY
jgi:hypothetical protein